MIILLINCLLLFSTLGFSCISDTLPIFHYPDPSSFGVWGFIFSNFSSYYLKMSNWLAWSLIGFAGYYFQRTIRTQTANYPIIRHDIVWNHYELLKEMNKKILLCFLISGAVFSLVWLWLLYPMNATITLGK